MGRLLLVLFAVGLVVLVLRRVARSGNQARVTRSPTEQEPRFEKTTRCARCGAYVPARLTVSSEQGVVCRDRCEKTNRPVTQRASDHDQP